MLCRSGLADQRPRWEAGAEGRQKTWEEVFITELKEEFCTWRKGPVTRLDFIYHGLFLSSTEFLFCAVSQHTDSWCSPDRKRPLHEELCCPFSASLPLIASQLCPFLVALRFGDNRCSGAWLVLLLIENYFPLLCNTWGKKGSSERAELLLWPTQVSYLHGILPCPQFSPGCFCSEIHCSKKNWERTCSYSFCPHRSPSLSIPLSTFGTGMYQVIHMAIWYKVSCPCAGVLLKLISS